MHEVYAFTIQDLLDILDKGDGASFKEVIYVNAMMKALGDGCMYRLNDKTMTKNQYIFLRHVPKFLQPWRLPKLQEVMQIYDITPIDKLHGIERKLDTLHYFDEFM